MLSVRAASPRNIIYALADPRTGERRYVGKSVHGLDRARSHFEPRRVATDTNLHKAHWIAGVLGAGLRPTIEILEVCENDPELLAAERRWIAHGRAEGWPLTNLTDGGDGMAGRRASPEERARRSACRRGKTLSLEAREKVAASKRGKPRPDFAAYLKSEKHRRDVSERSKGRPRPDLAERNRLGNPTKGRHIPDETKARIAEGQRRRHARQRDRDARRPRINLLRSICYFDGL